MYLYMDRDNDLYWNCFLSFIYFRISSCSNHYFGFFTTNRIPFCSIKNNQRWTLCYLRRIQLITH